MKAYDTARTGASLRARQLRRDSTDAEKHLWRALRESGLGKWRRQLPIGPFFADLACFSARLVVELDGGQHTPEADAARTRLIEAKGYRSMRFWNNDVLANAAGVIEQIAAAIPSSPSQAGGLGPSLSHGRGEDRPE